MNPLTILIAGRNTRRFLDLCLRSVRENFACRAHPVLVLDDASTDGSVEWLEENRARFEIELELHKGPERMGIVGAYNRLAESAETPAIFMVHTDMYFAPGADEETAKYLAPATVCTCTRIEPPLYPPAPYKILANLGVEPEEFKEDEFLKLAKASAQPGRFTEGIFAPVMCFKEDYFAAGGLDPVFAPQSREDSDLFNRMAAAGYRFRQSWSAFCYHFSGRGSRKKDGVQTDSTEWQATNRKNERNFIRRWGCTVRHDEYLKPQVPNGESISLVGLLGNEPENVIPYLEHLEPYFNEVVLVSDGPQPACLQQVEEYMHREETAGPTLLRREAIRVVERRLDGDFAAQRNFGQQHGSCEWVLHADLDERFERGILESLRDIVLLMRRNGKTVCGFPRINTLEGVVVNDIPREQWTPEGLVRSRESRHDATKGVAKGTLGNLDPQFRLLRRGIPWRGRVHETPEPVGRRPEQVMLWPDAAIRHPKTLTRQHEQDARYEAIATGASLRSRQIGDPGNVSRVTSRGLEAGSTSAMSLLSQREITPQEGPSVPAPKIPLPAGKAQSGSLRILMLATEYPPAQGYGLARYASELAAAMASQGHEVHVITCNCLGEGPTRIEDGVHVHDMLNPSPLKHFEWTGDAILNNIPLLERGLGLASQAGPFDALLSHDWLAGFAAHAVSSAVRLPWLLIMHDTEAGKRQGQLDPPQAYIAEMETWLCERARHVFTTSEFMSLELKRTCAVPQAKISIVPCGVNPKRFSSRTHVPDFRRLFAGESERLLVYAGRLSPMKGVEDLAEAYLLLTANDPHIKLVMAGEGPLRKPFEERLAHSPGEGAVFFPGHLSDKVLGALYRAADLVVMPSRYEPFGMVALEAASCGARVLASDVGGLSEIIRNSQGVIRGVPPHDPTRLAETIQQMLRESTPQSHSSTAHLIAHYSWSHVASQITSVLTQLRAPSPAGSSPVHT
ncbi:MAG: glycosyltransferase [Planctomycetes bacterium]|nr:glycosyltransferase [Planctomycetota bacterium]